MLRDSCKAPNVSCRLLSINPTDIYSMFLLLSLGTWSRFSRTPHFSSLSLRTFRTNTAPWPLITSFSLLALDPSLSQGGQEDQVDQDLLVTLANQVAQDLLCTYVL